MDLNKMTLEDVIKYCEERDNWILNLWIECEGRDKALAILEDKKRESK